MGLCHTEHDEGYVNIQDYQTSLDLSKTIVTGFERTHLPRTQQEDTLFTITR